MKIIVGSRSSPGLDGDLVSLNLVMLTLSNLVPRSMPTIVLSVGITLPFSHIRPFEPSVLGLILAPEEYFVAKYDWL